MATPRAVVFDLDGLMFNTEDFYAEATRVILGRRGHTFSPELRAAMMGRVGHEALGIMIAQLRLDDTIEGIAAETEAFFESWFERNLAPMPGLMALLGRLETARMPKAVATSSSRPFARRVLGQFDMEPRFGFVLTAEDVTQGKPHPEIYQTAAARFGVACDELVVLEDSANGCRAAVAAGACAVVVPTADCRDHDYTGAQLVIDSLADSRLYHLLQLGD